MPKKRERELDDSAKKRLRQSKLDFHFIPKGTEEKVETNPEEEIERAMNEEERAEARRRRELMASAAERRKQAGSPWTTPPHSPENQEDNDCSPLQQSSPSKASELPDVQSRTTTKSRMLDALSEVSNEVVQTRTTTPSKGNVEGQTYKRTDWYDYVLDRTNNEGKCSDELERPSTSKGGYEGMGNPGHEEGGKDFEEGEERSEVEHTEMEPASPTLEYTCSMYDGDGSQPLFTDSEPLEDEEGSSRDVATTYWKGTPISELNRAPVCSETLPRMRPTQDHTILFRTPVKADVLPTAFPDDYHDKWDGDHVRMPCSPENLYPVEDQGGRKKVQSRWELIEATLLGAIRNSLDLEEAILTYNARYSQRWNFSALHTLFTEVLDPEETKYFFDNILPGMVNLALQLPKICTQAIPLLRRQMTHSITMSQQQIASLLANAFFCTFPRRNAQQKKSEYSRFPDINFNRLFEMGKGYKNHRKIEKLKCILTYFRRVTENVPTGTVTISRRALSDLPRWDKSTAQLRRLHMAASGMIEKDGHGMLQMDFANKYIGGGALGFGCVQEEIRFMINPELIVTRLISEVLDDNECIIIKGAEQFSEYSGYANSFKWKGCFKDTTPRDSWGRKETEIVAIDALVIHRYEDQFRPDCLRRELNKAYCGFHGIASPEHLPAIASGNWGCGAFGGDKRVKGLIQLMAAAEAGRDLAYFTFEDKDLCDDMSGMHDFLASQSVTVGDLWANLHRYRTDVLRRSAGASKPKLFPYLYQLYTVCDSDTDEYETENTGGKKTTSSGSMSPNYRAETP